MHTLALLVSCHIIADFALQSSWMAEGKTTSKEIRLYHVLVQFSVLYLVLAFSVIHLSFGVWCLFMITHYTIDTLKAKAVIRTIWQDQLLHLFTLTGLTFFI